MSNHGRDEIPVELRDKLLPEGLRKQLLGATGRFPLGKLTATDEGEIAYGIAADPTTRTVILDFGKPVAWVGFPRENARKLAEALLAKVRELDG